MQLIQFFTSYQILKAMTKVKNTMPRHRVENMFRDAANSAFRFVGLLKKHEKQNDIHEKRLEDIGGKLSPTWIIMSVVGLCAAIGLGIFAAFNAQGAIAGLIDPMGDNTVQPYVFFIVGASIFIIGMIIGHFIHEGFTEGFQTDIHTGEKSPTPKLWLGVIGLVAAVVYVGYQFFLIKFAGDAAGVSKNNGPNYLPFIVA
jgi:NADH:ubiquinone oxidoreductase subunit 5 (subunit L)/multisubunit Na+/H+ antiporter MnhA subunit